MRALKFKKTRHFKSHLTVTNAKKAKPFGNFLVYFDLA